MKKVVFTMNLLSTNEEKYLPCSLITITQEDGRISYTESGTESPTHRTMVLRLKQVTIILLYIVLCSSSVELFGYPVDRSSNALNLDGWNLLRLRSLSPPVAVSHL